MGLKGLCYLFLSSFSVMTDSVKYVLKRELKSNNRNTILSSQNPKFIFLFVMQRNYIQFISGSVVKKENLLLTSMETSPSEWLQMGKKVPEVVTAKSHVKKANQSQQQQQ